uniref:hypothetical protein n=1 Tax=Pedobacter schmidteae TaxID=2201271 RepID=UPI0013CEC981|nr:hypothetical protein [Pedobacter schmidteae]
MRTIIFLMLTILIAKLVSGQRIMYTNDPNNLYNGPENYRYYENVLDNLHPYFEGKDFHSASIIFSGKSYEKIPLKYDLVKDQIITLHPKFPYEVILLKAQVNEFSFNNRKFALLSYKGINPGYYEVLYDKGKFKVLVKYRKKYTQQIFYNDNFVNKIDEFSPEFYLVENNQAHFIKKEKSLYKFSKSIKSFIRQHNLPIEEFPYSALPIVAEYLDSK